MAERQGERQSWTLCVSGDVDRIFIVSVDKESTVAQLKSVIEQRSSASVDRQTLYFQEQVMHNDSVLSSISGLNHGGMVYLSRRHFSLTIYNWLSGSLEKVQLKLSYSIMNQPLSSLKNIICQRFDVKETMFVCEEEILDGNHDDVLLHDSIVTDGAVVILHMMPVTVSLTDQDTSFNFYVPQSMTRGFLKQQLSVRTGATISQIESGVFSVNTKCDYFAKTADGQIVTNPCNIRKQGWGLDVKRLDGTKLSVHVEWCKNTPIVKLRECVEECTGVPTHQQRLTIGSTIVEDWDHEDRMMFIGDYPNIHDGSLLYLLQLEGGSRMKVQKIFISRDTCSNSELAKQSPNEDCCQTDHFYVNNIKTKDDLLSKMRKMLSDYYIQVEIKDSNEWSAEESVGPDFVVFVSYAYSACELLF